MNSTLSALLSQAMRIEWHMKESQVIGHHSLFYSVIVMQVYKVLYVLCESGKERFLSADVNKPPPGMITVSVCH